MNYRLNLIADFIKIYCKVLITIYIWSFLGFLRPNLELSSSFLPESAKYKSILLLILGTLIFTIFGFCLKIIISSILSFALLTRLMIFLHNTGFTDPFLSGKVSHLDIELILIPILLLKKSIDPGLTIYFIIFQFLERISPDLYGNLDTALEQIFTNLYNKKAVNNYGAIKSLLTDVILSVTALPILLTLCWLVVGIILFSFVEYLSIWKLFFSPFFLLLCTHITAMQFSD